MIYLYAFLILYTEYTSIISTCDWTWVKHEIEIGQTNKISTLKNILYIYVYTIYCYKTINKNFHECAILTISEIHFYSYCMIGIVQLYIEKSHAYQETVFGTGTGTWRCNLKTKKICNILLMI